jgi:transposase-like protein
MDREILKRALLELSQTDRASLIKEVEQVTTLHGEAIQARRIKLDNKHGKCPNCGSFKYTKFGTDKGSKRYRCKECSRTFTEYTGTWLAKLHKKDLTGEYLRLMSQEKSLDKIKVELGINKKTAFDWRHKILSGIENSQKGSFQGITESDDTFFLLSEKGTKQIHRSPRKRGGKAKQRGISSEQVAVIVTADRVSELDMTVARLGRIKKVDIQKAIGERVSQQTILCSDSHVSYKGFASDKKIEHHAIRADLKQYVKKKVYHVQHVNSIDSRMKKWIESRFVGVSTKYLQKYLNWFRSKEMLKGSANFIEDFTNQSLDNSKAWKSFKAISEDFEKLIQLSTHT